MDQIDDFNNIENILRAPTTTTKTKLEMTNRRAKAAGKTKVPEKARRGQQNRRQDKAPHLRCLRPRYDRPYYLYRKKAGRLPGKLTIRVEAAVTAPTT